MWSKNLVLVRHAESEGNIRDRDERARYNLANQDYPLTERGQKQAKITGEYLKNKFGAFNTYYVSYYERSKETMRIMYPEAKVYEDPRLAEAQRGIWHTMTDEQIKNRFPEEFTRKEREGLYHFRPLGGENWPDIELRIHSFLGTLNRDCGNENVLIVVHGHWLTLFQRLVHHFTIEEAVRRYLHYTVENASVTIYKSDGDRLFLQEENFIPWKDKI